MGKLILLFLLVLNFSCSVRGDLEKGTPSAPDEPYSISIVEPNDENNFYYRLYDSLNALVGHMNVNQLKNKDEIAGWLQDQFEDEYSGLGKKASHKNDAERTSDEYFVKTANGNPNEKASFTVSFDTDSIPGKYLYSQVWKETFLKKGLEEKIRQEKEKFSNGGTLIRMGANNTDTLYGYSYNINIAVVLNYYEKGGNDGLHSKFTIPARVVIYHQLKL